LLPTAGVCVAATDTESSGSYFVRQGKHHLISATSSLSPYAAELQTGVKQLRFDAPVEAEFIGMYLSRVRAHVRCWQVLVLLLPLCASALYLQMQGAQQPTPAVWTCFGVQIALSGLLTWLAFSARYERWYLPTARIAIPLRIAAFSWVIASVVQYAGSGTAVLTTNLFGLFFFSGLQFRSALIASLTALVSFALAAYVYSMPPGLAGYSFVTLLTTLAITGFVAYDSQRSARLAFLERRLAQTQSLQDPLTGLGNRRAFDEQLTVLWERARAQKLSVALFMIDIDHFKRYNDRYGHQAGDRTLQRIAAVFRAAIRSKADIVARYGGEELALAIVDVSHQQAVEIGDRLCHAIQRLGIEHECSPTASVVTVSVGGTLLESDSKRSLTGAVQLADENLYAAKHAGRNRAVISDAEQELGKTGVFKLPRITLVSSGT
jgi:diguanylate cyclase (GGDEF)-like protein